MKKLLLLLLFCFLSDLGAGLFGEGVDPKDAMDDFEWFGKQVCHIPKQVSKVCGTEGFKKCCVATVFMVTCVPLVQHYYFPDFCQKGDFEQTGNFLLCLPWSVA